MAALTVYVTAARDVTMRYSAFGHRRRPAAEVFPFARIWR
jgi:hypothetical protein